LSKSNYALRLQASLKAEAERVARREGTTLNQLINVALAEKLSTMRTAEIFAERAARADVPGTIALLKRLGNDDPPREGDEIPEELSAT
jgi:hypothetical protein